MKNKHYLYIFLILVVFFLALFCIKNKKDNQSNVLEKKEATPTLEITTETASSTDQLLLNRLQGVQFSLSGTAKTKLTLGSIVLKKTFLGNSDVVTFASVSDSQNKKIFYLLQFREDLNILKLVSSSRIDGAEEITGLRAADASSPTEYYIDVQFRPSGSKETQGVIKTIGTKGIQEDTNI